MRKITKRIIALVLVLVMSLMLYPQTNLPVYAAEDNSAESQVIEDTGKDLLEESTEETTVAEDSIIENQNEENQVEYTLNPIRYTNPLYEDIEYSIVPADIQTYDLNSENIEYTSDLEKVVKIFREKLVNRENTIDLYYHCDEEITQEFFNKLSEQMFQDAVQHTGVGNEGDYIKWHYQGWLVNASYSVNQNGGYDMHLIFSVAYLSDASQEKKVNEEVPSLLQSLNLSGKTDYQKIKAIYDYICSNITYDYANLENQEYTLKYTAYAALINKTSVCQGYASLFYRLALDAGVDARLISGTAGGAHAWNIVKIGEKYYNLDSTWDAGRTTYSYFLKNTEDFSNHTRDEEYTTSSFMMTYPMADESYKESEEKDQDGKSGWQKINDTWYYFTDDGEKQTGWLKINDKWYYFADNGAMQTGWQKIDNKWYYLGDNGAMRTDLFGIDDVKFEVLDKSTVALIDAKDVSGDFEIPSHVTFNNVVYSVTEIGYQAFYGNTKITSVTMPDTVVKIQDGKNVDWSYPGAFENCTVLEKVVFSKNLTYIGKFAFSGDKALKNITLPNKLETIMDEAFSNCSGITKLELPSSVTYVGQCALSGTSLVEFTIPKTCKSFHDWALDDIPTLTNIYVEPGQGDFCSVDGIMYTAGMSWIVCYPSGKTDNQYKIPDQVTTIRSGVFDNKYLEKLVLNNRIDESGLGTAMLQGSNISSIEVPTDNPYLKSVDGVLFSKDGRTLILYPPNKPDSIYFVPSGTVNIGNDSVYSFETCKNLEELYIPSSVEKISGIMWMSEKLKQVVFASESKITELPGSIFQKCKSLETICLPTSIKTLSDSFYGNEFFYCENLKILYAAADAGIYNCQYFGCQTLSGCYNLTVYGEGSSNALSQLAEQFYVAYKNVSQGCDKVLGITFKDTVQSVAEGERVALNAVIYPKIKSNEILTYTSSNESIATVDENGNVKGIKEGTCYITATSQDGAYARCQIYVKNKNRTGQWISSGSKWWYRYEDGSYPTDKICQINNTWYGFDASGWMQTGWAVHDNKWYYFAGNGAMQTGWQKINNKWYYLGNDGSMQTGWQKIDNKWYYLNTSMQTGWQKINNRWYYLNTSMQTGWQKINNKWYYLNTSMQTGWQKINNKWYYLNTSMQTGWQKINNKWYYFDNNGVMQTGKQYINGKWYNLGSNGAMQ